MKRIALANVAVILLLLFPMLSGNLAVLNCYPPATRESLIDTETGNVPGSRNASNYADANSFNTSFSVPQPISGAAKVLMVPVKFSDFSNITDIKRYIVYSELSPLSSYYYEVSYGMLSLDVHYFMDWFTLPSTRAYYGGDSGSTHDVNWWQFVIDSISAADPYVNYSDFEYLLLVHAGNDQAESGNLDDLWSKASLGKWYFSNDGGVNLGIAVLAETDPYNVFAHEFGHNLGLPDLYDYTYREEFAGKWSLMDMGVWQPIPSSIMAPEKIWLGWIQNNNVSIVNTGQIFNVTISKLEAPGQTLAVKIPLLSTYYTVEYRRQIMTDRAIPMEGVTISYVDEHLNSGEGIIKVMDAKPGPRGLDDAAFTSGMRFVDLANEVAVKVWSLSEDTAEVMVQKGFADLLIQGVEFVGDAVEGKETYFDVHVRNDGVTPSNSALVSMSINGTEFQNRTLPSVNPSSTVTIEFGPWSAKAGTNQIRVLADVSDDVVESNETNNDMLSTLNVSERQVVIDDTEVSTQRAGVNTSQGIFIHGSWSNDGSDVVDGALYVNGTAYLTNSTGWISFATSSSTVGSALWHVTGVNADGILSWRQISPDPCIVWDTLEVYDYGVSKNRCDVNSTQTIWARLRYSYDARAFDNSTGVLSIDGKAAEWNATSGYWFVTDSRHSVGQHDYAVPSGFTDKFYGLSVLANTMSLLIIWDRVSVTVSVIDQRIDVGSAAKVEIYGVYQYDFAVWNGTAMVNDTLTKNDVGSFSYTVASITDPAYGLRYFESNSFTLVFDRVLFALTVSENRIDVGSNAEIMVSGKYEYDLSDWAGTYALNDSLRKATVGKCGFKIVSFSDPKFNLTAFRFNDVSVIWDEVNIVLFATDERTNVGSKASVGWTAKYAYDGEAFAGNVTLDNSLTRDAVEKVTYSVKSISDPLYDLTAFTANSVEIIFDKLVCNVKADTLMPGKVVLEVNVAYQYDGLPVTDANVSVGSNRAENMGNGKYMMTFPEWSPYRTIDVNITRSSLVSNSSQSFFLIGNTAFLGSITIMVIIACLVLARHRKAARKAPTLSS